MNVLVPTYGAKSYMKNDYILHLHDKNIGAFLHKMAFVNGQ